MEQSTVSRSKTSLFAAVLSIAFVVLLVRFTDIALFDLNRVLNPFVIEQPTVEQSLRLNTDTEDSSGESVEYLSTTRDQYLSYKLLIYAGVLIPVVLLLAALWCGVKKGTARRDLHILYHALAAYALWMLFSLLRFGAQIAREQYQHLSLYGTLIVMIAVCAGLIVFSQRRKNRIN